MASCEYCWSISVPGEYGKTIARAEAEGWPCTKDTEEGARLRAGQFWDEDTKTDRRLVTNPITTENAPEGAPEVTP